MDFVMGVIPRFQQGVAGSLTILTRTIGVVSCATAGTLVFDLLRSYYTISLQEAHTTAAAAEAQAFVLAFHWVFSGAAVVVTATAVLVWSSRFVALPTRVKTG
jgi:hypothetical protein